MNEHDYAVIMAGGGGTRLWPLSRHSHPKQMLQLIGSKTLFEMAVDRIRPIISPERILIVTIAEQAASLQKLCKDIPPENYLIEPMPRGTASVVGLAAVTLQQRDPQAVMAVLTADHIIQNEALFRDVIRSAHNLAREDYLVTLGVSPTYPATGYGYIEMGNSLKSATNATARMVNCFKEKPDEATARQFIADGNHVWNSGMFFWKVGTILAEFERQMPVLMDTLNRVKVIPEPRQTHPGYIEEWTRITPQTIDYGIMEAARKVAVIPVQELGWNDVGSWESLFDFLPKDNQGNIWMSKNHLEIETGNSLLCTTQPDKLVAAIGLDDIIIIDTEDALLICKKEDSQKVKQIVDQLSKTGKQNYL